MEAVLVQVVKQQAKVIILDIAGMPNVDTKVADHILKTTAAVQLLGGQTILTGISASVARTVVQLGVEITRMHTRSNLSEGIELALSIVERNHRENRSQPKRGGLNPWDPARSRSEDRLHAVATIQIDLHDDGNRFIQNDVLEEIEKTAANGRIVRLQPSRRSTAMLRGC